MTAIIETVGDLEIERLRTALKEISAQPYWDGDPATYAATFQRRYNKVIAIADDAVENKSEDPQT